MDIQQKKREVLKAIGNLVFGIIAVILVAVIAAMIAIYGGKMWDFKYNIIGIAIGILLIFFDLANRKTRLKKEEKEEKRKKHE